MGEIFKDGVARPVSREELDLYGQLRELQSRQPVPVLQHEKNRHEYLMLILLDGTGHDADDPAQRLSNIGHFREQILELSANPELRVGAHYSEGVGAQKNLLARYADGAVPFTWDEKIENSYRALTHKAKEWKGEDPDAQISIAHVGYSRGAVLVPGLARLIDNYGIADPDGMAFGRDERGNISVITTKPPLVAPGQAAQAIGLFDPVATTMPRDYDARPAPSVISGFSILAVDERRETFPHQAILDLEMTADGRFVGARAPGGHSNVGGGNRDEGLESLAFNAMADYLNGLRDRPLFTHRALPEDPARYTVYQARGVTAVPGLDDDGVRNVRTDLANCKIVDPCRDAEPIDRGLAQQFDHRLLRPTAPFPAWPTIAGVDHREAGAASTPSDPAHPDHARLETIRDGVRSLDRDAGKAYDDASERLSRRLLVASKEQGLGRVDHVVLGSEGRQLFAIEGGTADPWRRWAAVDVMQAVRTPIEESDTKLEAANRRSVQEPSAVARETEEPALREARRIAHGLGF